MNVKKFRFSGKTNFDIKKFDTGDTGEFKSKEEAADVVTDNLQKLTEYQDKLFADGKNGMLIVFQAMDAAGKDGAIKHVFSGLNPQGVNVHSFKAPSTDELAHDYMWRAAKVAPPRGKIAIFNRSYYEDVLIAKVHKLYKNQNLPEKLRNDSVIENRYEQIRNFEQYLFDNGIYVVKFFLDISKEEQTKRFLARIDDSAKNWKFSKADMLERNYWDDYQDAYEKAINETAKEKCPWYVVPADKKWFSRALVSSVLLKVFKDINPAYPIVSQEARDALQACKEELLAESAKKAAPEEVKADKPKRGTAKKKAVDTEQVAEKPVKKPQKRAKKKE